MNDSALVSCTPVGIFVAIIARGMKLADLLIIYLACGAPIGVYYFLQNRHRTARNTLLLKSVLRFVFWIPFAIQMVVRSSLFTKIYKSKFDADSSSDAKREQKIEEIKKFFENNLFSRDSAVSIYEFREIFDRYVGLSLEIKADDQEIAAAEQEIFRITNHHNKKIGEVCLNRRNRIRLSFHQKLARRDYLEIIGSFLRRSADPQKLLAIAIELAETVHDAEAPKSLAALAKEFSQTQVAADVRMREKETWNSEKHKPLPETTISTNLQVLTARANLSGKD